MKFHPDSVQRFAVHDSELMDASMAGDDYTLMVPAVDYDDLLHLYRKLEQSISDALRSSPGIVQTRLMTVKEANEYLKNLGLDAK